MVQTGNAEWPYSSINGSLVSAARQTILSRANGACRSHICCTSRALHYLSGTDIMFPFGTMSYDFSKYMNKRSTLY